MSKRIFAVIIDWYCCYGLMSAPVIFYNSVTLQKRTLDLTIRHSSLALITVGIGLLYYVLVPLLQKGRTFGKRVMKLEVKYASYQQILIRQLVLLVLLSPMMFVGTLYPSSVAWVLMMGLLVDIGLVFKQGISLHERLSHTSVYVKE